MMFKQATLKNYRTHKLTTVELSQITLLIGNNNAGKTNLLSGIQHFSRLIKRGLPNQDARDKTVEEKDFFPCRYILAEKDEPVAFAIKWANPEGEIFYEIALYENVQFEQRVACQERITIQLANEKEPKKLDSGYEKPTNLLALQEIIESALNENQKKLCQSFFLDFAFTFTYHFQPSFLKGLIHNDETRHRYQTDKENIIIPSELGYEGRNLQKLILYVKENDENTFSRFIALMQRFDNSFHGFRYDSKSSQLMWQFALKGKNQPNEFPPEMVSDGLLKVAAVSLLVSSPKPPTLVLLEEIENSINPGNIQSLMYEIWQATSPFNNSVTQFILTSHNSSVLCEFNEHLDYVYMMLHLDHRNFQSEVVNLNTYLDTLNRYADSFDGEVIEKEGKRLLIFDKYRLVELWHCGAIG